MACGRGGHVALAGPIQRIVGETAEMDRSQAPKRLEDMVRADLVAPVGRKRDAMGEEENLAHQPIPRAMSGPSRLATASGRRCQSRIWSERLELVGSASRRGAPGAVQVA